ncbi:hypothetical protein AAFC00_002372 [Neodothiora populina]
MILDGEGNLVWMSDQFGAVMNLKSQQYQGKNYLTFWGGHRDASSGQGAYYMLDETYQISHQVHVVGDNMHGDLHEFKITENNTALVTSYKKTVADLSGMGRPVDGWITDSIFQEIDIATGDLLFEWRASDHFDAGESHMTNPFAGYKEASPFDFFHINSIDKDAAGDYLISSRHLHLIATVSHETGEILWALGGERNQFKDLSDGAATDFKWQHDARWVSEAEGILTLFDNEEAGILHIEASHSKGMMLQLDVANRTVKLLHSYVSMQGTRAPSQGSLQVGPDGGLVVIGWGHSPAYSEFEVDGSLVCETHFGASWLDFWGRIVSYRTQKVQSWVGKPDYPPQAQMKHSSVYASWNGATEIQSWELQGATDGDKFESLDVVKKERNFESVFALDDSWKYTRYRVAGRDQAGNVLGYTAEFEKVTEHRMLEIILWLIPLVLVLGGAHFLCMRYVRSRGWPSLGTPRWKYSPLKMQSLV